MARRAHRHRGTGFPLARTFATVVSLHVAVGGGLLWIARTESGRNFAKTYNIKLFEPPKPPPKTEEAPPPPPPKVEAAEVPPPPTAGTAVAAAPAPAAAMPSIGGGGANWSGGKFVGDSLVNGPDGAFNAAIMGRFRKHYHEPPDSFASAELEIGVTGSGAIRSYRLLRSSGNPANDQAILTAAQAVQSEGVGAPPDGKSRIVTVRFIPTS
jgi:periplasmic protein TonB